jgi:hypothetical protein
MGATTTEGAADPGRCPVDALDDADGPVTIDFWHGMTAENETTLAGSPPTTTPPRTGCG